MWKAVHIRPYPTAFIKLLSFISEKIKSLPIRLILSTAISSTEKWFKWLSSKNNIQNLTCTSKEANTKTPIDPWGKWSILVTNERLKIITRIQCLSFFHINRKNICAILTDEMRINEKVLFYTTLQTENRQTTEILTWQKTNRSNMFSQRKRSCLFLTIRDKLCNSSSVNRKPWPNLLRFVNIIQLSTIQL